MDVGMLNFSPGGQQRKSSLSLSLDSEKNQEKSNDDDKRKMMHREIERKRRQEMAARYASLRSVLPSEYIKGKLSLADHMNGAVNCIKHLQTRIKVLGGQRDELKIRSSSNLIASLGSLGPGNSIPSTSTTSRVAVHPCLGGVEIVISTIGGSVEQGLILSRLLKILLGQGLSVISCATAQVNKRLVCTIQSEVSDPTCVDFLGLQQIMTEEVSSFTKFSK